MSHWGSFLLFTDIQISCNAWQADDRGSGGEHGGSGGSGGGSCGPAHTRLDPRGSKVDREIGELTVEFDTLIQGKCCSQYSPKEGSAVPSRLSVN